MTYHTWMLDQPAYVERLDSYQLQEVLQSNSDMALLLEHLIARIVALEDALEALQEYDNE